METKKDCFIIHTISINYLFALILFLMSSMNVRSQDFVPDSVYIYTFPQLSLPLSSQIQETNRATSLSFYLPLNYSAEKKYPLVLYIAGGQGGPGTVAWRGKEIFDTLSIITANFPLFKKKYIPLNKDSSNYFSTRIIRNEDADTIWKNYSFLLDTLFHIIPNIDRENTFMGGFSNGAHTTAALLNQYGDKITIYFRNFYFVEGGFALENMSFLSDCNLLFFQGEKIPKGGEIRVKDFLFKPHQKAIDAGINSEFISMKGYGHAFPEEYYDELIDWMQRNMKHGKD